MLRKDVKEAIGRLWPDGIVKMNVDYEDSWFLKVQPKLARALKGLKGAHLLFEREADGNPVWRPESDPEQEPPDECERSRSYHLYFIVPEGVAFEFTTDTEDYIEGRLEMVHGDGQTGWCVAVSLLAPFAVIALGERIAHDNGDIMEPMIEMGLETMGGDPIDPERHFSEMVCEEAFSHLMAVRGKIAAALEKFDVTVLPAEEWRKRAPRFRLGGDVSAQTPVRVLDTLFFEEI
jgi:hypothetical protein